MEKNFLKSSLQNATFNIVFQVTFRLVTFLLNAFVLRNISQDVLGVMNVRLLLLESTILFLTREPFRRACLSKTTDHNWPQVINLIWLTVPLSCLMCCIFGWVWLHLLDPPSHEITTHYALGVYSICASCILSMFSEPLHLVAQAFLFVKLRVLVETVSVSLRTFIFTSLVIWRPSSAVLAFSIAQIASQVCYTAVYCVYFYRYLDKKKSPAEGESSEQKDTFPFRSFKEFLPRKLPESETNLDWRLSVLTWSFAKQGILKQLLTEGERYVMTLFQVLTFKEQGIYDVVNNLGSLAARFLFRPIEESAYFYFSQLVHRDKPISRQNQTDMKEAALVLEQLLRCVISLGLLVVCFGQGYARLLLMLYGGPRLAESFAPTLLRIHCCAILLLAINGTTEAYALATMSSTHINKYNKVMAYISVAFLLVTWILGSLLGGAGFVIANCCNMSARIFHSLSFINWRYKDTNFNPLRGIVPSSLFMVACVTAGPVSLLSEFWHYEQHKIIHFFVGVVLFAIAVGSWAFDELEAIRMTYRSLVNKRRPSLKDE